MLVEALHLARGQFAMTAIFHILWPILTISLSAFVLLLETLWTRTSDVAYYRHARFWSKLLVLNFAVGVVSGIPMEFQFGTNWPGFMERTGNIAGPLLGYEVLTAFFLEATFLGVLLFGGDRVPKWLHAMSAVIVAFGTALSAFWILSANSWMQTPAGFEMRDGIAYPVSWFQIVFNPSFPYRFVHMLTAAYLATSLVVLAVGARYLVAGRFVEEGKTMARMGVGMLAVLAPLQLVIGDFHGLNTAKHQPAKVAAMEAHWDGSKPGDLVLFAWPDAKAERNRFEVSIPKGASLVITHDPNGLFPGLKDFAPEDRPPVWPVFFSFRIMVAIGLLMIAIGFVGAWLWWRGRLFDTRWFLKPVGYTWSLGFIAILAGWMVTEIGRQPWVVYGVLRTAQATSPILTSTVAISLALFVFVYCVVFGMGVLYIRRLLQKGPTPTTHEPDQSLPNRPLAAAQRAAREALASGGAS